MATRRVEHHHYTLEQVAEHVRDALGIVYQATNDTDERVALLPVVFDKIAGKQVILEEIGILPTMHIPGGQG